ncbi:hypothetical protein C2845_PM16G25070 [Panicum miliaceum]|uniref:Uncharacterized protein n=1 Tax=Panicum miliaceum TaxID=4540 RepID=A0A3L6PYZ7_PANMI|nr:hypothetical protein C2845_PM16G25070 [Panicum miliaceum]
MAAAAAAEIRMATVFGEARPENGDHDADDLPRRPVLFHANAHFQGPLRVVATDLRSLAWHCSLDLDHLQDLQDDVGIGGSCSDFLDYLYSSFSSAQVKLLFPAAQGADTAELVATKAKGLPRITISLHPVATSALKDVIADFSLALYASYKTKQEHASRVASPSKVPPAKATKRVAHVSRRARVRGALLQDADENDDGSS